ncbi:hypothetical protein DV738_g4833, partial [Chaetothyriales sp. CBS 135597]
MEVAARRYISTLLHRPLAATSGCGTAKATSQRPRPRSLCSSCGRRVPDSRTLSTRQAQANNHQQLPGRHPQPLPPPVRRSPYRAYATVQHNAPAALSPLEEYDERVHSRQLRDDEHQRMVVAHLNDLHELLKTYEPPKVVQPDAVEAEPKPKRSLFSSLFGGSKESKKPEGESETVPNMPKGLYMYGDVGSGKTMLMDLFYDTLPPNVASKTRIHFHNFMQDVHKRLHKLRMQHGNDVDVVPFAAADIAEKAHVLCFDEFQVVDVADAMILRRLIASLMSHGVVLVTTSNRHPDELYKNGIQRQSFIPCINLLKSSLRVINLDSETDYRKLPRPPSGVYHHPLDAAAKAHADKWFNFLGDPKRDPPHPATLTVWGREVQIPQVSGKAARFTFHELIGRATGAADYIEMARTYEAFIVTDIPGMTHRDRDWARRFITFLDAVYDSQAKLVLTTADVSDQMRALMDDLGMNMAMLKESNMFSGDEERFAFARALSRLSQMNSREWVERGLPAAKKAALAAAGDEESVVKSSLREDPL